MVIYNRGNNLIGEKSLQDIRIERRKIQLVEKYTYVSGLNSEGNLEDKINKKIEIFERLFNVMKSKFLEGRKEVPKKVKAKLIRNKTFIHFRWKS